MKIAKSIVALLLVFLAVTHGTIVRAHHIRFRYSFFTLFFCCFWFVFGCCRLERNFSAVEGTLNLFCQFLLHCTSFFVVYLFQLSL
jgi:hypothetical protein